MVELIILRKNGLAAKLSGSSAVAFCYTMGQGRKGNAFSRCSFRYVKKKRKRKKRHAEDSLIFFFLLKGKWRDENIYGEGIFEYVIVREN